MPRTTTLLRPHTTATNQRIGRFCTEVYTYSPAGTQGYQGIFSRMVPGLLSRPTVPFEWLKNIIKNHQFS